MTLQLSYKRQPKPVKLGRYAGKWVALVDGKILAHNRDLGFLMAEVKRKKLEKEASVLLVPRKDEGPYILPLP